MGETAVAKIIKRKVLKDISRPNSYWDG